MLDDSNFLEPTQKYIDKLRFKKIKLWFNLDLIHIAQECKNAPFEDKDKAYQSYSFWLNEMGVEYSINEICERFKDYHKKDFDKLIRVVMKQI